MSYKSAFLGCGSRSRAHARAYSNITRGVRVACCDLIEEKAREYAEDFDIPAWYTDLDEMLEKEQPDLVHMSMPPTIRVSLMTRLAEAGVPAVIVEKPICIGADDYKALRALEASSDTRFTVNHQLRYHNKVQELLAYVQDGGIGEVRFLDASSDDHGVVSWSWDFGDGAASSERNPAHVYAEEGSYRVVLVVMDTAGQKARVERELEVGPPGEVTAVDERQGLVTISLGARQGVKVGDRFQVFAYIPVPQGTPLKEVRSKASVTLELILSIKLKQLIAITYKVN